MKAINYYTLYKNRKDYNNTSFKDWLSSNYTDIDVGDLYHRFFKWWLDSEYKYLTNNVFILWFCKNYPL